MKFVAMEKLPEMKHAMTATHMDLMVVHQPVNNRQVINAMGVHRFAVQFVGTGL